MSVDVRGVPILSLGEFHELARRLDSNAPAPPELVAWFAGEDVEPAEVFVGLNVGARLASQDARADELIELALDRLRAAFPDEAGLDQ